LQTCIWKSLRTWHFTGESRILLLLRGRHL
jgi:hypothetical protein